MKKLLLTSLLCGAASFATLSAASADVMDRTSLGPYIGVQGGYTFAEDEVGGTDIDVDGGNYGVFVGFQADTLLNNTVNRLGIGLTGAIEAHYNWSDADDSEGGVSIEKNHDWGVSFRPGLNFISDATPLNLNPYGIIGYRRAEFEASGGGFDAEEDFDGFELGLGTELVAYDNVGIRAEYSYTWYSEEDDIDPSEHNVRIGAAYHF